MAGERLNRSVAGTTVCVFVFFSNRLGCLSSVLISAILTVILLLVFAR
ncbi:hypothetical protein [Salinispora arenicola]|uniref:Uncharacterized protein n=1 Tax=Salinispora arenicola TaxID=168697 RepID=A0A542XIN1_SALAC|nr:hypothetical protein [Salinispora arenicola]MCN0150651.1 hypothetical protein [Salinispora arenicola]TQL35709.1 hypothetical protein FB564_0775 [Salinispora arenicola]